MIMHQAIEAHIPFTTRPPERRKIDKMPVRKGETIVSKATSVSWSESRDWFASDV
jgi:hypothetical protein